MRGPFFVSTSNRESRLSPVKAGRFAMAISRMTDEPKKRLAPVPVRFTEEQIVLLDQLRGDMSRSGYIVAMALRSDRLPTRSRHLSEIDRQLLGQILGLLGLTELRPLSRDMRSALKSGSLADTPETTEKLAIIEARLTEILGLLLAALDVRSGEQ